MIQIDLVQHTAALVSIGRLNSQPEGTAVANGEFRNGVFGELDQLVARLPGCQGDADGGAGDPCRPFRCQFGFEWLDRLLDSA